MDFPKGILCRFPFQLLKNGTRSTTDMIKTR
jgi:hypothetical protein